MKNIFKRIALLLAAVLWIPMTGCSASGTPALTYEQITVTDHMYAFWLSSCKSDFLRLYNNSQDTDEFWDTVLEDGQTVEAYALSLLRAQVSNYAIAAQMFKDYKLKISAEKTDEIEADILEKIEYYGGREALNEYLGKMDINVDILKDIYIMEEKLQAVYEYLYGTNGAEAVTQTELDGYYRENYSRIQYILIYTEAEYQRDENGNLVSDSSGVYLTRDLSEEEKQQKQQKLETIMTRLENGEDFETVKAECDEYAFDTSYYENGFYLSSNELNVYGYAMVTAAAQMQEGEIRRVDDSVCSYVIKKEPLIDLNDMPACDKELLEDLETYCITEKFQKKLQSCYDRVAVDEEVISKYSIREAYPNSLF